MAGPANPLFASKQVGDVAADFQVLKWQTKEPLNLIDYEGQIVILYFFNPFFEDFVKDPARVMQEEVFEHIRGRGGNQHGVPVIFISLNTFPSGGESETSSIIN